MVFSILRNAVRRTTLRIRKIPTIYKVTFVTVATCSCGIAYLYSQNQFKIPNLEYPSFKIPWESPIKISWKSPFKIPWESPNKTPLESPEPPVNQYKEEDLDEVHPKELSDQKLEIKHILDKNGTITTMYNQISTTILTLRDHLYNVVQSTLKKLDTVRMSINDQLPIWFQFPNIPFHALPPELPKGFQQPLTLCFDLDLVLESLPDLTRAGTEYFFMNITQFAEVVVLSTYPTSEVWETMIAVDRLSIIPFRVGHEYFWDGQEYGPYKRDLRHLNRDLSKVVVIDYDKSLYPFQPENVLVLPQREWQTNPTDTDLFDIVPILYVLAREAAKKKDIREIIKRFDDIDPAKMVRVLLSDPSGESLFDKQY